VSTLELLPDVERLVSRYLRTSGPIDALIGERVYTTWPNEATLPLVLVTRIGGEPPFSRPLVLDECDLQLDVYGNRKHEAHQLAATVRAQLALLVDRVTEDGVVHAVTFAALRYVPDESFSPAQPRYVVDVSITTTPQRAPVELEKEA
jgi:Protein of unknown function (DUF3168)